ncbi:penicillin amidase [Belliella buryatensis]|uniref:Penicillin amidase n=1 Tax=Belliella buryatensis TaxID=1500549 RepID=A0A239AZE8_9BACT|nr:penicillin acylase family protein [Belliella buryatensis]SNS00889.1 penicillin amidase [Belliella buryatensis]
MKNPFLLRLSLLLFFSSLLFFQDLKSQEIPLNLLQDKVEVIRDENGINHIYAQNEHDLFFSQGYLAAKDRLFQFEIWRRRATGTAAEIFGARELERDKGARLFQFRGDKKSELSHYHPRGEAIVDAFVAGINTYIQEVLDNPELLPIEFQLLDILPEFWTWEVVISRHQGLLQNVQDELRYSRVVSLIGEEKAKNLFYFHPQEPDLEIPESIPHELLFKDILAPYNAFRAGLIFHPEDIKSKKKADLLAFQEGKVAYEQEVMETLDFEKFSIGSNNWIVSGKYTESGFPYMANDPHRVHAIPSLRYMVHLHAPGWNVVGGGEPVIPGVSIGHNEYGAWGLTIFETDNEDLRVYDINPENHLQYHYKGEWKMMESVQDTIKVLGENDHLVTHYYTIHGPVTFIDKELHKAVAVECAWLKSGGAPYLASLRMDQSKSWEEFRDACTYNHIPAENMIWADREGNIGWQATGISPIRNTHSGLIISLGDGSMDWDGFLPIEKRPNVLNPEVGYVATANENVTPNDYPHMNTIGFEWADSFRGDRVREVLAEGRKFTMEEMGALQNDYLALPARILMSYLKSLFFEEESSQKAAEMLLEWDFVLDKNSIPAGIYVMWERVLRRKFREETVPQAVRKYIGSIQFSRILEWIADPKMIFSEDADQNRDLILKTSFEQALVELEQKLGPDRSQWQYGQAAYKHALFRHPLSLALGDNWDEILNSGPVPRGGYSFTPGANAYGDNNTAGASFRIIVNTGDWEKTLMINTPGQSGDPKSPYYKNLFQLWADDGYFVNPFSYENVKAISKKKIMLVPAK